MNVACRSLRSLGEIGRRIDNPILSSEYGEYR